MTEPDPIATLAAQVEELRGQLARSQGDIGHLRERLEAESSQTAMLRLDVKGLREALAEATEKHRLKPPPAPWWIVDDAEAREMFTALHAWVERFLRPQYPGYLRHLRPCWPNHREAVWELSTLRAEWDRVYADEENRDLQGALNWHDRLLPGVVGRLADAVRCDESGCRMIRSPPP